MKAIIDIISKFVPIVISIVALWFSIYAYKRDLLSPNYKKRQLELILDLINDLYKLEFEFRYYNGKSENNGIYDFCLAFYGIDEYNTWMPDEMDVSIPLLQKCFFEDQYDFVKLSNHPFFPSSIATELKNFEETGQGCFPNNKPPEFVVLEINPIKKEGKNVKPRVIAINHEPLPSHNPTFNNFLSFVKACKALDRALRNWLKKVGITDINFERFK